MNLDIPIIEFQQLLIPVAIMIVLFWVLEKNRP